MEQNALFRKRYGSFRRFFVMLGKARLPYLWIVGYLAVSALIANVSVSTTEYSAALFAGQVGLFAVVLPYLFFTLLSLVIGSISSLTSNLCLARIDRNLRRMVWKKVVHLPLQFYEANNPKELLSRITTDVTSISTLIMQVLLPVFTTAYSSLLMLGRVSSYDQRLMWALVIVLPVNILISFVLGRMRFGVADLINRRNAQLTAAIAERANNMLLIKSMGTEEKEAAAGEARMRVSYQAEVTDLWVRGLALPVNAIAGALQSVAIILAGRAFYSAGALDLTQWIAYYGFAIQLTNILSNYCNSWSNFKGAQGSVDRVSQIMDEQEEPLDKGRDAGALAGNISLRDVCFSYGEKPLFTDLDAEIPAGKITAIVGPSGSGKTTLLNLIDRLYPLAKGTIAVDGQDIAGISLHSFRQAVGYVTQESVMYSGTIRQNLLYGLDRTPDDQELDRVCEAVGILDFVREQPEGYDTPVGEAGASLSGGQRQRFSVARALLQKSDILLLDEATAAMDISGNYLIRINKGELYNGVIIGYALMNVFNALLSMLINLTGGYGSALVTLRARKLLWRKILHLPMREVERRQPSALISGLVNDITQASLVVQMAFNTIVSLYSFFRCCWEMYRFDGTLSLYMLLLLPIAVLVFALVGHLQYQMMLRRYDSLNVMTTFFSEHISAAKHVKAQAMEDLEVAEGLKAIDSRYKADLYYAFMVAVQTLSNSLYNTIGTIVIALCGSDLIRQGKMPETGINDFSTYKGRVDQYTAEVLTHYQTLKGTQGALQYVGVLLDGPEEDPQAGNPLPDKQTAQDIRLERVSFGYIPQQPVLHDLSFTIPHGKVTAIIGNNGSGKSTLLKLLQGIYAPDSGRIWLGGAPVDESKPCELRRQFGYILQNNPLFSGSVCDNIAYGETGPADQRRVEQAARLADADSFIRQLPNGYDTDVGAAGALLSGGQRQRIAIARALYIRPTYLLMDEAGASLDHRSDSAIFRTVREELKGHTILVVAHDMRTVMDADLIVVLNRGELEATGTHDELLAASPTYRDYLKKQGFALPGEEAAK